LEEAGVRRILIRERLDTSTAVGQRGYGVELCFRDGSARYWWRRTDSALEPTYMSSGEHYDLPSPGWRTPEEELVPSGMTLAARAAHLAPGCGA